MFEAGRNSLFAFSSKSTRPVSSDATLIPTIADASSGLRKISAMRVCSSASVFVVLAIRAAVVGVGVGATTGDELGLGAGAGVGLGEGVTFLSRCGF